MQNILRKAAHCLVTGQSGTGKTSYVERLIIGSHHARVFIFDHQGEFQQRLNLFPVKDFNELERRFPTERILCFDYSFEFPGQLEESFDDFSAYVFDLCRYEMTSYNKEALFVCDEVQKVTGPNTMPLPLKEIMQTGRRFNLDTALMSQQPNELHNSLRNQVTEYVTYRITDYRALEWVERMGIDPDKVRSLPDLTYLWRQMQTGEQRQGKIDYPKKSA